MRHDTLSYHTKNNLWVSFPNYVAFCRAHLAGRINFCAECHVSRSRCIRCEPLSSISGRGRRTRRSLRVDYPLVFEGGAIKTRE